MGTAESLPCRETRAPQAWHLAQASLAALSWLNPHAQWPMPATLPQLVSGPFPHTLPPQGGRGPLSPVLLLLSPWDPSDVDQAWDLCSWGAGLLQNPLSPERRQNACASSCWVLMARHLSLFSVQGAPLQGGGVGVCWLHHAHRGVLQEQGRVLGSGGRTHSAHEVRGPVVHARQGGW